MKMNYEELKTANATPAAASMVKTFRAMGYSLETAMADILDNSISAGANNIWISRIWKGGQSIITIKDDGIGMNHQELIEAMRPGSQNPLEERSKSDLGRFGLGLKTASFSQCRRLTVYSKKADYKPVYWTWDLDYVAKTNQWELLQWIPDEYINALDDVSHGTLVVWSCLDRIINPETSEIDINSKAKFSSQLDKVKRHISMTFHRFIEEKVVKIFWCEHEIEPWNPFCEDEPKTQIRPTENIIGGISVKGYVLPHKSAFSSEVAYTKAEGINGWAAQQGFYVYRGKRLLLAGDWLGLFRKEEHYKLVRIKIDLPNTLDTEWQIDIKKSRAYPPMQNRSQLESYAKAVRSIGCEVYRHRGKILKQKAGTSFQPLWCEKKKDNKWSFVVNREHDMIQQIKSMAHDNPEKAINTLLSFIEETLPTKTIYINEAKGEESQLEPFTGINPSIITDMMRMMYDNQIKMGKTSEQAKAYLKTVEPFNLFEDLIENL